jgi:acyl dehydratase
MDSGYRKSTYQEIAVGDEATFSVPITDKLVDDFGYLSGNLNPLHMDEEYGKQTEFHHRIAHGMVAGCLFSRLLGMYLPGEYSLCLSQTLQFHNPITLNVEVLIRGKVTQKTDAYTTIVVHTTAEDPITKKILVSGDALVKVLK